MITLDSNPVAQVENQLDTAANFNSEPFDINSLINTGVEKKITTYIASANTPNNLGHPCDRRLVFARTRGEIAQKHSVNLELIYFLGRESERMVRDLMEDDGFVTSEYQQPLKDYTFNLSAKIDFKITHPQLGKKPILCEVKSMSPTQFPRYKTQDDFLKSKVWYYRGYYTQVQSYLHLVSLETQQFQDYCYVVLFNKSSGQRHSITFRRDDEHIEEHVFKKCERINKYVQDNVVPEAMPYDEAVCSECPFPHICNVGQLSGEGAMIIDKPELVEAIREWKGLLAKTKDDNKRCDELNDYIKDTIKEYKNQTGKTFFLLDNYKVKVSTRSKKEYTCPATTYDVVDIK